MLKLIISSTILLLGIKTFFIIAPLMSDDDFLLTHVPCPVGIAFAESLPIQELGITKRAAQDFRRKIQMVAVNREVDTNSIDIREGTLCDEDLVPCPGQGELVGQDSMRQDATDSIKGHDVQKANLGTDKHKRDSFETWLRERKRIFHWVRFFMKRL